MAPTAAPRSPQGARRLAIAAIAAATLVGCGGGDATPEGSAPAATTAPEVAISGEPGCDLYAAVSGSDVEGDGSIARPWRHVDHLVERLRPRPGREVGCLRAGTFTATGTDNEGGEPMLRFDTPGVTLTSFPGERARVVGRIDVGPGADGVTIADLDLATRSNRYPGTSCVRRCGNSSFPIAAAGVTVRGNDITNDATDICLQLVDFGGGRGDDAEIVGNRIHDCGQYEPTRSNTAHGIYVNDAAGAMISDNVIADNASFGVKLGPRAIGATVAGNVIDSNGVGVLVGDQPPCPTSEQASHDNLIVANVITRSQVRNNVEGYWATPEQDPSCFDVGDDSRGNVVAGNCVYADNPYSDGPDDFYNHNDGIAVRDPAVPQSGGFTDDGTNLAIPAAQQELPPIYADATNGDYHLLSVAGAGNDCLEADDVSDDAAAANRRWSAPSGLSAPGLGSAPEVAIGSDGTAVAAWLDGGGVAAVVRGPGGQAGPGSWSILNPSAARPLPEPLAGSRDARAIAVAVGDGAAPTVAWDRPGAVMVSTHDPGGWSAPASFPAAAGPPALAVGAGGSAVLAWRGADGSLLASVRPPGADSPWGERIVLDRSDDAVEPSVAIAPGGEAVAAWSAPGGGHRLIRSALWDGGSWSAPERISSPGSDGDDPSVGISAAGEAVLIWRSLNAGGVVTASTRSADRWSAPVAVSGPATASPALAVGSDGGAIAAWQQRYADGRTAIVAAARPPGDGFASGEVLSAPGAVLAPRVAAGASGEAVVAWPQDDPAAGYPRVVAVVRDPAGAWEEPRTLSEFAPGAAATAPAVAIGATGGATAVWSQRAPDGARIFSANFWF